MTRPRDAYQPSPYARQVLRDIFFQAGYTPARLTALLRAQTEPPQVAFSIRNTGNLALDIPEAVETLHQHRLILKHLNAMEADIGSQGMLFRELRLALKPWDAPEGLVSVGVLERMTLAAREGHLHHELPLSRLMRALPAEVTRRAPEAFENADRVCALFDGANRQRVGPGDEVWLEILLEESIRQVETPHARKELGELLAATRANRRGIPPVAPNGLEAIVRPFGIVTDANVFHRRMGEALRRICLVRVGGDDIGTGFLVDDDLVLTNYHVLERVIEGHVKPQAVSLVFDYVTGEDGQPHEGVTAHLVDAEWRIDDSPPTKEEQSPDGDPDISNDTDAACLDFVLVRLAEARGRDEIAHGVVRGHFDLRAAPMAALTRGTALTIVGHPARDKRGHASPQALAIEPDSVIATNPNGTRVRYRTNTHSGSSGSPVCLLDWRVVALHHYGKEMRYNQGIPVSAILARPKVDAAVPRRRSPS